MVNSEEVDMSANYLRRCRAIMIDEMNRAIVKLGGRSDEVLKLMKLYLEAPAFAPHRRQLLDEVIAYIERS